MEIKPVYEFLLWDNCNNNCKFCFQREKATLFNLEQKKKSLDTTLNFIKSVDFKKGSHILLIGGEIFDSKDCFSILNNFNDEIVSLMLNGTIDLLYINTNLIYSDLSCLYHLLYKIKENNLFNRFKFTSSYDLEGRFRNAASRDTMLSNLKIIKYDFPDVNIVVNTILTKKTCQDILEDNFSPKDFCEKYNCDINLIPYIIYIEEMSAERNDIFKVLLKVNKEIPGYLDRYIKNFDLPQDKLLYKYEKDKLKFCSCEHLSCGHSENFKRYSKEGTCFICDIKNIYNMGD